MTIRVDGVDANSTTLAEIRDDLGVPTLEQVALATALAESAGATAIQQFNPSRQRYTALAALIGSSSTSAASGRTGIARAFDCPADFAVNWIDGVRVIATVGAGNLCRVSIYERPSSSASPNAVPETAGDILVARATVTHAELVASGGLVPVTRYRARSGFIYFIAVEGFTADGVTRVAMAHNTTGSLTGQTQRQAGYVRTTGGWTNLGTSLSISVGLMTADMPDIRQVRSRAIQEREAAMRENYRAAMLRNETGVRAESWLEPLDTGISIRFGGDSLCNQGGVERRSSDIAARYIPTNTIVNAGSAGRTVAEIDALLSARSSAEWGWTNICNGSTNDLGTRTYNQIKADIDALIAKFTGQWIFSPGNQAGGVAGRVQTRLVQQLRATHGARIYDWSSLVQQWEGALNGNRTLNDAVHPSTYGVGKLAAIQVRMIRAMNGGAPFVHEEVLPLRAGDAAGTVYSSGLILGTVGNAVFSGGINTDNAVAINAANGQLTRGAGALAFGSRELIVRAGAARGEHEARKTFLLCRDATDFNPTNEVEFRGGGLLQNPSLPVPGDTAAGSPVANSTRLSMVIPMRFLSRSSGNFADTPLLSTSDMRMRCVTQYAAGGNIGSSPFFPIASDPFAPGCYFLSIDTVAGTLILATNEVSTTVSIPADSAAIRLDTLTRLFEGSGTPLSGVALRRFMLFTGRAFNFADEAVRALFYNPATRLPIGHGGTGTVDGTQAQIDIYGREGDWFLGMNDGSIGALLPQVWRGLDNLGVRDVAEGFA